MKKLTRHSRSGLASSCRSLQRVPRNTNDPNGYYEALGVDPWADRVEIRRAFERKARILHPDGASPDEEQYSYLSHIYDVLSSPEKREEYNSVTEGTYISQWEVDFIKDAIAKGKLPRDILSEVLESESKAPREEVQGYDFYGDEKFEQLSQEWVQIFVEVYHSRKIETLVRVGVHEEGLVVRDFREDLGFVVYLLPSWLDPSPWIAVWLVGSIQDQ